MEGLFFGDKTSLKDPLDAVSTTHSVIIKNIPTEITEAEISNEIVLVYKTIKNVNRFVSQGKVLTTVKIDFGCIEDKNNALLTGVFIKKLFVPCQEFIRVLRPTRCHKCQQFGHMVKNCKNDMKCVRCSGNHSGNNCKNDIKCCNCAGNHQSSSTSCSVFQQCLNRINRN